MPRMVRGLVAAVVLHGKEDSMLVLSRKVGERIVIDGKITVTVTEIRGGLVRLGITAPPDKRVDRKEVFDRRQQEAARVASTQA